LLLGKDGELAAKWRTLQKALLLGDPQAAWQEEET
jgi:hypothetical protein